MPTVYIIGSYRFYFNSREEKRRHIHIVTPEGIAKFWLEPLVSLDIFHNLSQSELYTIESIIKEKHHEFIEAWNRHFGI
ncbi:MAG: DUF4160 domain-containing protein [Candidatus Delongbacteria bacterium]|nr:DUF4160 domain-containing protein [Candidatus Delongbacteria bacterium]